jgi:hypothetical protein
VGGPGSKLVVYNPSSPNVRYHIAWHFVTNMHTYYYVIDGTTYDNGGANFATRSGTATQLNSISVWALASPDGTCGMGIDNINPSWIAAPDTTAPVTVAHFTNSYNITNPYLKSFVDGSTSFTLIATDAGSGVASTHFRVHDNSTGVECRAWQTYSAGFTLGESTNGTFTIVFDSIDVANNNESLQFLTIYIDATGPSAPGFSYSCGTNSTNWISASTSITMTAGSDNTGGSGTSCSEMKIGAGAYYLMPSSFNIGNLTDGSTYQILAYSIDNVLNSGTIQYFTVQLDKSAPASSITYSPFGSNWVSVSTVFAVDGLSDGVGSGVADMYFRYSPFTAYHSLANMSFTLASASNGTVTIDYYSVDNVGNTESVHHLTVRLDIVAPTTGLTWTPAYSNGNDWASASTTFEIIPADAGSGISATLYKIDSGVTLPAPVGPFDLSSYASGVHSIYWYSVDNVGNIQTTQYIVVHLDKTKPSTTIGYTPIYSHSGKDWVDSSTTFTLTPDDGAGSGVAATEYRINGGGWNNYITSFTLGTAVNGTYIIEYYSYDNVANMETTLSIVVYIDALPANTTCSFMPAFGVDFVTNTTSFTLAGSDDAGGSGVASRWYNINGIGWGASNPFDLNTFGNGTYTIEYRSIDNCGNIETAGTIIVRIDTIAPNVTLSHSVYNNTTFFNITFTLNTTDNIGGSGLGYIQYRINNSAWVNYTTPFVLENNASWLIEIKCFDNVNNTSNITSFTLVMAVIPVVIPPAVASSMFNYALLVFLGILVGITLGIAGYIERKKPRTRQALVQAKKSMMQPKHEGARLFAVFAAFMAEMSITECMRSMLGMGGSNWSWTSTIGKLGIWSFFCDWSIWYLDIIPATLIFGMIWVLPQPSWFKAAKFEIAYTLAGWLVFDWVWWATVSVVHPSLFSWTDVFYFTIVVPNTPMWTFALFAALGAGMAILLLKTANQWRRLVPFVVFLVWIYLPGGIDLVIKLGVEFYEYWSVVMIPVIAGSFLLAYWSSVKRIHVVVDLDVERAAAIGMMIGTAAIIYFAAQYNIIDITKGLIISAVNNASFPALSNIIFILSLYVAFMGIGFFISAAISFRDVHAVEYTLYTAVLTYVIVMVASAIVGFSVGFVISSMNWLLLPIVLLVAIGDPAQFLYLIMVIFIIIEASIDWLKRVEI